MDLKQIQKQFKRHGLRDRPAQLEMIEKVNNTVKQKQILIVEAPTGTGKTISYLLGSFYAKTSKQNVIISTATIALQEQLIKKDLPLLTKLIDEKVRFALAKGRQNYLCLAKLYQDSDQQDLFTQNTTLQYLRDQVESDFWDGDKENLKTVISDDTWQSVTTDSNGCSGKRCSFYEKCFFYKARNKMHTADFIVTNHSLLLSDLELGAGVLLPEPENNIYIIDECHHLPERSISHFSKSVHLLGSVEWINQINFITQRTINSKQIQSSWHSKITQCIASLVDNIKHLKAQLDGNIMSFAENTWRIKENEISQFEVIKALRHSSAELLKYLDEIITTLEKELELCDSNKDAESAQLIAKHLTQFKFVQSRIKNFNATWEMFSTTRQAKEPPIARWFEQSAGQNDYICHCSPINVGLQLKSLFWDLVKNGALLCSATVRSLGSFDNFQRRSGLKTLEHVQTAIMPAIFDYQHSVIFIPTMENEPAGKEQDKHRLEALDLLPQLILPRTGTLVLFTSRSAMEETYRLIDIDIKSDVLMQGQHSKNQLIEKHKKRIRDGQRSIIFGLSSMAEGVDLPADYCQHVIIHKLPFAVPSSPVELTRNEWITQHNLNPFMLATLPETSIKLTQYIGRLIRQEDDIGIVTILDRRLYSKGYGKKLLENLPPFTQLINCKLKKLKEQTSIAALFET